MLSLILLRDISSQFILFKDGSDMRMPRYTCTIIIEFQSRLIFTEITAWRDVELRVQSNCDEEREQI